MAAVLRQPLAAKGQPLATRGHHQLGQPLAAKVEAAAVVAHSQATQLQHYHLDWSQLVLMFPARPLGKLSPACPLGIVQRQPLAAWPTSQKGQQHSGVSRTWLHTWMLFLLGIWAQP